MAYKHCLKYIAAPEHQLEMVWLPYLYPLPAFLIMRDMQPVLRKQNLLWIRSSDNLQF